MHRRASAIIAAAAALCLNVASAQAGPGSNEIAEFEQAVRRSAGNPKAGPMAPQSIGAQLGEQRRAKAAFDATLARAKRFDARGNRAGAGRRQTNVQSAMIGRARER